VTSRPAPGRFSEKLGLGSVAGGRHRGWGNANRIVPLGRDYVELVGVVDRSEAAASDFGRPVLEAVTSGDQLVGWAVATDDLQRIARRLHLEVIRGSRTRPDGSTLSWQLAGVAHALATGALPFFIEWDGPPELHPARAAAVHRVMPRGIAWVEVATDEDSLRVWLGEHELPLRVTNGHNRSPQSQSAPPRASSCCDRQHRRKQQPAPFGESRVRGAIVSSHPLCRRGELQLVAIRWVLYSLMRACSCHTVSSCSLGDNYFCDLGRSRTQRLVWRRGDHRERDGLVSAGPSPSARCLEHADGAWGGEPAAPGRCCQVAG
jgi:Glyoxalase-like domain